MMVVYNNPNVKQDNSESRRNLDVNSKFTASLDSMRRQLQLALTNIEWHN